MDTRNLAKLRPNSCSQSSEKQNRSPAVSFERLKEIVGFFALPAREKVNNLMLDVEANGIGYLNCAKITQKDMPWYGLNGMVAGDGQGRFFWKENEWDLMGISRAWHFLHLVPGYLGIFDVL